MSEELDVLKEVAGKLNAARLPYMLSGSVAMNFYAQPRMTRDIDIVIALKEKDIGRFIPLFRDDFYLEEKTIKDEVERRGMFNLIHNKLIIKIDFIVQKDNEFNRTAFSRRRDVDIDGVKVSIISAEDLMLAKLKSSMTDTKPATEKIIVNMLRQRTGEERLKMGCSMFDLAKKIVMASIKSAGANEKEMRHALFLRFYQDSFNKKTITKILQKI